MIKSCDARQEFYIIAGLQRWGAGKYVSEVVTGLIATGAQVQTITTNGMFIFGLSRCLINIIIYGRRGTYVFQPSISGLVFFRDLAIIFVLKACTRKRIFLIVSQLSFKNKFLRSKLVRRLLFNGERVVSCGPLPELSATTAKLNVIFPRIYEPQYIGSSPLKKNLDGGPKFNNIFAHIGYLNRLKGFDLFEHLAEQCKGQHFFAIGDGVLGESIDSRDFLPQKNMQLIKIKTREELHASMWAVAGAADFPWLIYSSRNDLAPLTVYEAALIGFVPAVKVGSSACMIMENFLPPGCFARFESASDLSSLATTHHHGLILRNLRAHIEQNAMAFDGKVAELMR